MTIGQRIAELRKRAGLSQEALGEELGVSRQAISKWESDAALPDVDKLIGLARKFNVTVGWLCGNSPQIEKPALPAEDGLGGESLGALLARLTPAEKQRVRDFAAGLLAARNG